jgi:hypothetical protein
MTAPNQRCKIKLKSLAKTAPSTHDPNRSLLPYIVFGCSGVANSLTSGPQSWDLEFNHFSALTLVLVRSQKRL